MAISGRVVLDVVLYTLLLGTVGGLSGLWKVTHRPLIAALHTD